MAQSGDDLSLLLAALADALPGTCLSAGGLGGGGPLAEAVLVGLLAGLVAGDADLGSGSADDGSVVAVGCGGNQTDILDILCVKLHDLPGSVVCPLAGGDGLEVHAVVGDLDLITGDGAVGVAGLAGLVAQAVDQVVLGQLELEPVVLIAGAVPVGVNIML